MGEDQALPPPVDPELLQEQLSGFDHKHLFQAYEANQVELIERLDYLLSHTTPQPVDFEDPDSRLLVNAEEVRRLWGLFPKNARNRAIPPIPIIKSDSPRWFTAKASAHGVEVTDKLEEALSPTSNGLAHTETKYDEKRMIVTGVIITLHEIPENGFSSGVRKLAQVKSLVHELAHTLINPEMNSQSQELVIPNGASGSIASLLGRFIEIAEQYPPISHYSSAYRNPDNSFPREDGVYSGTSVAEELVETITAYLLGFVVNPETSSNPGLNQNPFEGREDIEQFIADYLDAKRVSV